MTTLFEDKPAVGALLSWCGSNRILAPEAAAQMIAPGRKSIAGLYILFAGGLCELKEAPPARTLAINDLHTDMINVCRVAAHPVYGPKLYRQLRRMPTHPVALTMAQNRCKSAAWPDDDEPRIPGDWERALARAADYFVCSWMGRSGQSGGPNEFGGNISTRFNAGGGDSNTRYRNAVAGLVWWRHRMQGANFTAMDGVALAGRVDDAQGLVIYADPPFYKKTIQYVHDFDGRDHERLAAALLPFKKTRVVIRYYDHPRIRALYDGWHFLEFRGRKSSNAEAPEVLIVNQQPYPTAQGE